MNLASASNDPQLYQYIGVMFLTVIAGLFAFGTMLLQNSLAGFLILADQRLWDVTQLPKTLPMNAE